jgi:hypothetical protein
MARTFFFLVLLVIFGCAGTQTEAPTMPEAMSQQGNDCVKECEAINTNCADDCNKWIGVRTQLQRKRCFKNCNKRLGDCYSICEQL